MMNRFPGHFTQDFTCKGLFISGMSATMKSIGSDQSQRPRFTSGCYSIIFTGEDYEPHVSQVGFIEILQRDLSAALRR